MMLIPFVVLFFNIFNTLTTEKVSCDQVVNTFNIIDNNVRLLPGEKFERLSDYINSFQMVGSEKMYLGYLKWRGYPWELTQVSELPNLAAVIVFKRKSHREAESMEN